MMTENVDEYDDSVLSSCYSNTVFIADDEQADIASSAVGSSSGTAADNSRAPRSARGVQFDVNDHQERPADARPQISTVVTKDRKPTVFEKKFQGIAVSCRTHSWRMSTFCYTTTFIIIVIVIIREFPGIWLS